MTEQIYHDENGKEYVLDERGNRRPPMKTNTVVAVHSGWTEYDSSEGHCALCGSLTCRGNCFK